VRQQRLGQLPQLGVLAVAGELQEGLPALLHGADGEPALLQQRQERLPEARLGQPRLQPRPLVVRGLPQPLDVARVAGAGQELQLAELHGLEAAGRREQLAEAQEVLRRHRLEHHDLLDEDLLDAVHALQRLARLVGAAREHLVPGEAELVQALLEPQLAHLVDRDEQQLVVGGGLDCSTCWSSSSGRCR
jgi:hypothetical protein